MAMRGHGLPRFAQDDMTVTSHQHTHARSELLRDEWSGLILNHMVQYAPSLDSAFAALSDPTRRGILEQLGRGSATISDLAGSFGMTLTGIKKHVRILEDARLVTTAKAGRVRTCSLGPRRLEDEQVWIATYQRTLEARYDRLDDFLRHSR